MLRKGQLNLKLTTNDSGKPSKRPPLTAEDKTTTMRIQPETHTLRAPLSDAFLQRKDVVNQCLQFAKDKDDFKKST